MKVRQKKGVGDCDFVEKSHSRSLMGFEWKVIL